jgi:hypothetical protein
MFGLFGIALSKRRGKKGREKESMQSKEFCGLGGSAF